jgi:hypothetical protein
MTLPSLRVFAEVPDEFAPRAAWVFRTLFAPLGRRVELTRDGSQAAGAALAYAGSPVEGVPTIPCDAGAMALLAGGRPLPAGAFTQCDPVRGDVVGAFASGGEGFAVPFDLVASAFVLLACWDEFTRPERDRFGRLPFASSVFAANPALRIEQPAVDAYVALLRELLTPRLEHGGLEPLPPAGWMWDDEATSGGGFAVALTHDVDNVWRWTPAGLRGAARATARALRHGDVAGAAQQLRDILDWLIYYLPRGADPYWTFLQILEGEDARAVRSTFYVIARHTARVDGGQPAVYVQRIPAVLDLLRRARREVGVHGNDADRLGADEPRGDRDDLAARAGTPVTGMRYHYLRCLYHETLPLLERAGFEYDSSLAFAEHEGFRCGAGFPFSPYCIAEERPLRLLELPLALMDTTLQGERYRGLDAEDAERAVRAVLGRVAAHGGGVAILWHNVRFDRRAARGYDDVYWRLLDELKAAGARVSTAADLTRHWQMHTGEADG